MTRAFGVSLALVLVWAAHPASVRQTSAATRRVVTGQHVDADDAPAAQRQRWSAHARRQPARPARARRSGARIRVRHQLGDATRRRRSGAGGRGAGCLCIVQRLLGSSTGSDHGAEDNHLSRRKAACIRRSAARRSFDRSCSTENRLTITTTSERHTPSGTRVGLGSGAGDRQSVAALSKRRRLLAAHRREACEPDDGHHWFRDEAVAERDRVHTIRIRRGAFSAAQSQTVRRQTPTPEEALAALRGYIGYYGALTVYPGQVFHNILAGVSPIGGSILRRSAVISGDELTVQLPPRATSKAKTRRPSSC